MWNEMKAKWMDKKAKVWFIEKNGSTKMDSTTIFNYLVCMVIHKLFYALAPK
jgi:hypothetical protein